MAENDKIFRNWQFCFIATEIMLWEKFVLLFVIAITIKDSAPKKVQKNEKIAFSKPNKRPRTYYGADKFCKSLPNGELPTLSTSKKTPLGRFLKKKNLASEKCKSSLNA